MHAQCYGLMQLWFWSVSLHLKKFRWMPLILSRCMYSWCIYVSVCTTLLCYCVGSPVHDHEMTPCMLKSISIYLYIYLYVCLYIYQYIYLYVYRSTYYTGECYIPYVLLLWSRAQFCPIFLSCMYIELWLLWRPQNDICTLTVPYLNSLQVTRENLN